MFDQLPGIEVGKLIFKNVTNDALRKLEQKNVFKTKQELYEWLKFYNLNIEKNF